MATHREVIMSAIQFAERNTKMHFKWDSEAVNVAIDLLIDIENTDLNFERDVQSCRAHRRLAILKLKTAIKQMLAAHKVEEGSPLDVRLSFAQLPEDCEWWDAARSIYAQIFRGEDDWEDDATNN